ncbi:MAG: PLP-dependent transferase [Acidimicrobiia bacterium]|nr:PLP-dependent transferase [Acidimicrobiia bacterium]MDH3471398.1 PLP-dependent transferase [Acidimicrobiia bacterium]
MADLHTSAVHGDDEIGDGPDVAPPIRVSTTFDRTDQDDLVYRRYDHSTTRRLEAVMGAMEGGHAVAYASGMAATSALVRRLSPSRIALPADVYGGTKALLVSQAARGEVELVEPAALGSGDLWWTETPSNPKCIVSDIEAISQQAHSNGALVAVDSTFATPVLQNPLALGADYVVHSTTKFIGGHSDAMGGILVSASPEETDELRSRRDLEGAIPGSLDSWLTLRGLRTLPLRVERQSATAQIVAEFLANRVPKVWYPSLADHPGHDVAARQMRAGGGVVSFEAASGAEAVRIRDSLKLFRNATSLGGVESVADLRADHEPDAPPELIRCSIGLEAPEDLVADLEQAL